MYKSAESNLLHFAHSPAPSLLSNGVNSCWLDDANEPRFEPKLNMNAVQRGRGEQTNSDSDQAIEPNVKAPLLSKEWIAVDRARDINQIFTPSKGFCQIIHVMSTNGARRFTDWSSVHIFRVCDAWLKSGGVNLTLTHLHTSLEGSALCQTPGVFVL